MCMGVCVCTCSHIVYLMFLLLLITFFLSIQVYICKYNSIVFFPEDRPFWNLVFLGMRKQQQLQYIEKYDYYYTSINSHIWDHKEDK